MHGENYIRRSLTICVVIKSKKMKLARSVECKLRNVYIFCLLICIELILRIFKSEWRDNIKVDNKEKLCKDMDWIKLARTPDGRSFIPGREKRFISNPQRQEWLWVPASSLSNENRGLFLLRS